MAKIVRHSPQTLPSGVKETPGILVATVKSYVNLNGRERREITDLIKKLVNSKVNFHYLIDKTLLGGLRIEVGDWIIDTSLQNALSQMATHLKED